MIGLPSKEEMSQIHIDAFCQRRAFEALLDPEIQCGPDDILRIGKDGKVTVITKQEYESYGNTKNEQGAADVAG